MSFSQDIKQEIMEQDIKKECCKNILKNAELATELKNINMEGFKDVVVKNSCCTKSLLKGLFLGSGCIVDPNTDYHFEISVRNKAMASYIIDVLNNLDLHAKMIKRTTSNYVVYIKDSEEISLILSYLNVSKALLKYENIRVERSLKNNINRNINCETANLSKTISTAYKQIEAIKKLKRSSIYDTLPNELKEIANLREKYPEMSLDMLKDKCSTKITKSGVNHRLNKIIRLSESIY